MEQRDLLKNLLIAGGVFLVLMALMPRLLPPMPPPPAASSTEGGAEVGAGIPERPSIAVPPAAGSDSPRATGDEPSKDGTAWTVVEAADEQTLEMGSTAADGDTKHRPDSPYRMRLTLSNIGASVEDALLTDHAARLKSPDRYAVLSPIQRPNGATYRSLSVEKINVDGVDVPLFNRRWNAGPVEEFKTAEGEEGQQVSFSVEVQKEGVPALRVTRTLRLPKQSRQLGRHDLYATVSIANLSPDPHRVVVTTRGGAGVTAVDPRADDRFLDLGEATATGHIVGKRTLENTIAEKQSVQLFAASQADPARRLSWAASANTYFTCTIAPVEADGKTTASYISELSAFDADGDRLTVDDAMLRFTAAAVELRAGSEIAYASAVFLGEKDGKAFRAVPEYFARNYYYQIEQGFGWCTFTFLVELMIWLLNSLHFVVRDYGIAIIILVLIVRALLHPITKKGQVNMVRMQHKMAELGPKIEEIKKKYANDKARLNQEMMKLNINPAGQLMTCLPMFIQMPIWVALYLSLSNNILMRHEPLFYGLTWIDDLTAQDALIPFSTPFHIPIVGWEMTSFNLLPILVAVFMYIQQKTQPKPKPNPNMTEQQRQQQETMQRMMPMMSIMMMLIFYKMPSGLNLYIMFSSLFGWLEQARIRQHIREQEEAGTLHGPAPTRKAKDDFMDRPPRAQLSWWQRLQKAAEVAQKAQRSQRAKPRR